MEEKSRHRKHSSGDSDSHHTIGNKYTSLKEHKEHRKHSTSESDSHHRKHSTSESDKGSRERKQSESNDSDSAKHSSKERHGSSRSHHGSSSKRNSSSSESPVKKHRHNSSSDHPRQSPLSPVSSKAPTQPPPTGRKGYDVGDLIWARTAGASFHPAIVTKDPHYKFHTKIVKAEVGTTNLDPETRKPVLSPDAMEPARQYHIQFLGDNKRMWQTGKLIIPYKGITHYENLAISDVKNIKLYRPKTEAMKSHWRDAVLIAKHLETLEIKDRIRRCDHARLGDIGDKALQRKLEYDEQVDKHNTVEKEKERVEKIKSPKIVKIPMKSPIQALMNRKDQLEKEKEDEKEKKKSEHYRRKEEMDYKMHRISSAKDRDRFEKERKEKEKKERTKEKKSKEKAEKRKHEAKSSDSKQSSNPNEPETNNASNTKSVPIPKHINTLHGPGGDSKVKIGNGDINNDGNNEDQADSDNDENGKEDKSSPNRQCNGWIRGRCAGLGKNERISVLAFHRHQRPP